MTRKETGKQYIFNSAEQVVFDVWGRPRIIEGKHILEKVTDTLMDRIYRRSWYVLDGKLLVDVGRGSYIETRCLMEKVFIKKNTLGDTRTAEHMPTREEFNDANESHIDDVKRLTRSFCDEMLERISHHDWTKMSEPYATMFYDDMKANIEDGKEPFTDMEWYKLHVNTERHHLNERVPDDVDLIDVVERLVDCVAAGMARSGSVYDVTVPDDVLQKAVANTVKKMIDAVEVDNGKDNS